MTQLNYATLKVGQKVAVGRYGSWHISNQGTYIVSKVDKVKVVIARPDDANRTRAFSVRTGKEKGYDGKFDGRDTFIESVETQEARLVAQDKEATIKGLWRDAEKAAERKDMSALKTTIALIEAAVA